MLTPLDHDPNYVTCGACFRTVLRDVAHCVYCHATYVELDGYARHRGRNHRDRHSWCFRPADFRDKVTGELVFTPARPQEGPDAGTIYNWLSQSLTDAGRAAA